MWFLPHLRANTNSFLDDTCKIEQEIESKSSLGIDRSWQLIATGVACRLITVGYRFSNTVSVQDGQKLTEDLYRLILPVGTALQKNQRITLTSSGKTYQVVSILDSRTDSTDFQVVVKRLS